LAGGFESQKEKKEGRERKESRRDILFVVEYPILMEENLQNISERSIPEKVNRVFKAMLTQLEMRS